MGDSHARFACTDDPSKIGLRPDDVILLCVKSQNAQDALERLASAGAGGQPVFCLQNGVANERMALRHFDHVHGVSVMLPSEYLKPGEIYAFGTPHTAILDVGRAPSGHDGVDDAVAECFKQAGLVAYVRDDVMAYKYGKLLLNLRNILVAAFEEESDQTPWLERANEEAVAAYRAAGIVWHDVGWDDPRREVHMSMGTIPGVARTGSSSLQSLLRGAGSIETDYLNGEIALLGRLHGVPVPVNAVLCRIGRKLVAGLLEPGKVTNADLQAELASAERARSGAIASPMQAIAHEL